MPDNPTLSDRLRRLQNTACYCDGACGKHPALDCLLPEILQALDDNERLTKRVARLELDLECELGVRHMTVDRLEGLVEGMPTHEGNFLQRIDELREGERDHERYRQEAAKHFRRLMACDLRIEQLESDAVTLREVNARYILTIAQLEKERAEAVDRVLEFEQQAAACSCAHTLACKIQLLIEIDHDEEDARNVQDR